MRRLLAALLVATPSLASAQTLADGAPKEMFEFSDYATGLGQVTDMRWLPDGRAVIISKTGEVRVRALDGALKLAATFPVDTFSEKGLLGVEVHPAFAENRTLYFYYSAVDGPGASLIDKHRLSSFVLNSDDTIDFAAQKILVRGLIGPQNHDGGGLALSRDGTAIFIGVGDSGCNSGKPAEPPSAPTNYYATCLTNGNGKILRVRLDGTIPSDNPLASVGSVTACGGNCTVAPTTTGAPRADLWAWGFRNPWRLWVDPVTDKLWVGDVGEANYEEITIASAGRHHGWPWREAAHGWPASKCRETLPDTGDCVDPVFECVHSATSCQSITGGVIVDTCSFPEAFRGLYYFADNATGELRTLQPTPARDGVVSGSARAFGSVPAAVSLRTGPDGALYVASLSAGKLVRFAPKTTVPCPSDAGVSDAAVDAVSEDASTDAHIEDAQMVDAQSDDATFDSAASDATVEVDRSDDASEGCDCTTPRSGALRHDHALLLALTAWLASRRNTRR